MTSMGGSIDSKRLWPKRKGWGNCRSSINEIGTNKWQTINWSASLVLTVYMQACLWNISRGWLAIIIHIFQPALRDQGTLEQQRLFLEPAEDHRVMVCYTRTELAMLQCPRIGNNNLEPYNVMLNFAKEKFKGYFDPVLRMYTQPLKEK